ncbi:LacI family DNA-binding transcriptional regulator [Zhenhengia yiwuensis]|uniref:LacI family DNA-binding transcriptional regulator n=1 Tax=Zhenhengia yiwuensis TaxID=2763666 RepID=UPI001B73E4DC|nr:LacI family DNA-binding transcriptional regulator [Zhenhengia yiwuensis]MBP3911236.1 LacI family DNA-binding transcriptional regulator [Niameybacter sp.]MDY3368515.1 LacI family DNA-binding transcriptional regulator [Zhenhengia yiwuensis]
MNIKDIAKLAGVGVSTVSRVLNNHPDVKKETRDKVLEVIKEHNYVPNNSARILKSNNMKHIGVLVKGVFNPFFSEMLKIIEMHINQIGYTMILHHYYDQNDSSSSEAEVLVSFIKEKRLQGVICLGGNFEGVREESFEGLDVPIVLTSVDSSIEISSNLFSCVGIDNEKAAYEATNYLIQKGHKHIGMILGDEFDAGVSNRRAIGYMRALEENHIPINKAYITLGGYDFEPAYESVKKLLSEEEHITAIFAISDIMAIGAGKAVIDLGYKIGEDISILGFDGLDIGKYYNPALTTIKQPQRKMAYDSINLLVQLIEKKCENQRCVLETKLVERMSVYKLKG